MTKLDGDVVLAIGREVLRGIPESESKFAPMTAEMKKARAEYEEVFKKFPPGVVAEIPWSQSESPDPEKWAPHEQQLREMIAEYRANDAIKAAESRKTNG